MAKRKRTSKFTEDEIAEDILAFEKLIRILTSEYNQFFAGSLKTLPTFTEGQINKLIKKYQGGELIQKPTEKYRFFNIVARFHSFREMWGRKLRQLDNASLGTHISEDAKRLKRKRIEEEERQLREKFHQTKHYQYSTVTTHLMRDSASAESFHTTFQRAYRLVKQNKDSLTREKFTDFINRQTETIKKKKGCDAVKFTLLVKNGEVKLTAKPVKKGKG